MINQIKFLYKRSKYKMETVQNIKMTTALLLCLLLTAVSSAQDWGNLEFYAKQNTQVKQSPNEQRVVFMGNSITRNWKKYSPEFFKTHTNYINRGIGGQTTPQMLVRFRPDVINLDPEVVVIMAGTNDIAGNTGPMTLDMTFENIVSMVELAQSNGIQVVLCSVLPAIDFPWRKGKEPADKIAVLNGMLKGYALAKGITYVDYYAEMVNQEKGLIEALTFDGVHPNEAGYKLMEPIINKVIAAVLKD